MDFALTWRDVRVRLISGSSHYEEVVEPVLSAQCSVWIGTANLKELMVRSGGLALRRRGKRASAYRSVLEVFDGLARRGVELRVLHASPPSRAFRDAFDRHPKLVSGGLELRLCPRVHLKTVIVDGGLIYLGSANWTGAGLGAKQSERRNFELGVISEDAEWIDRIQAFYDGIWRGHHCAGCKQRDNCEAPLDL